MTCLCSCILLANVVFVVVLTFFWYTTVLLSLFWSSQLGYDAGFRLVLVDVYATASSPAVISDVFRCHSENDDCLNRYFV